MKNEHPESLQEIVRGELKALDVIGRFLSSIIRKAQQDPVQSFLQTLSDELADPEEDDGAAVLLQREGLGNAKDFRVVAWHWESQKKPDISIPPKHEWRDLHIWQLQDNWHALDCSLPSIHVDQGLNNVHSIIAVSGKAEPLFLSKVAIKPVVLALRAVLCIMVKKRLCESLAKGEPKFSGDIEAYLKELKKRLGESVINALGRTSGPIDDVYLMAASRYLTEMKAALETRAAMGVLSDKERGVLPDKQYYNLVTFFEKLSECLKAFLKEEPTSHLKKRILVQDQGGHEFQTGGIRLYSEDLKFMSNTDIGPKDFFEMACTDISDKLQEIYRLIAEDSTVTKEKRTPEADKEISTQASPMHVKETDKLVIEELVVHIDEIRILLMRHPLVKEFNALKKLIKPVGPRCNQG